MKRAILLLVLLTRPLMAAEPGKQGPELKDGDVVALIGGGFIEREGQYGYIETALTARYADRDIKFRNLGWSGDTVWCESRAYFGTPEDGFKHLLEHVDLVKPTVIIVNYGGNEAFAGETGLAKFVEGYNRLLDELEKRTKRVVLLSPTPLERLPDQPEPLEQNRFLKLYTDTIAMLAVKRGYSFIDLFEGLSRRSQRQPITYNGVHLNEQSLRWVGAMIATSFVPMPGFDEEELFPGATISGSEALAIETRKAISEKLRRMIIERNELFFHRHRPQNETYLRGFRKHEQGNNAVEIYEFEKLVAEKEAEIARLRGELLKALQSKEGGK